MNTPVLPQQNEDALTAQLFRYAQDLDELMQQHNRLQEHHRMILQSLGREVYSDDLLPGLLAKGSPMYWVTDPHGQITHASSKINKQFVRPVGTVIGQNVLHIVSASQSEMLGDILKRFADHGPRASAVHCRLHTAGSSAADEVMVWDALLMQLEQAGKFEIYWFLSPATPGENNLLLAQGGFVEAVDADHGLMVANPFGTISAVNAGYCRITGYSAVEMVGKNPRMLSSGRHDNDFYQNFWLELLDAGRWSGTIFNRRKGGQIFLEWQAITMVENVEGQVLSYISAMVDLSHTEPASKRLQDMAYTDPLTGLPNRRMLVERLDQFFGAATEDRLALALLFIDLDRFKPINDEMGHDVGDLVLQEVTARLRNALLPGHLLVRVGGDEFVVVLNGAKYVDQAEAIAASLLLALKPPMHIKGRHLVVGASIGCAHYPQDGEDMVTLLQHADAAMYSAKQFGISFCNYDTGMEQGDKPNLEFDLWLALERQEISLVYQPQVRSDAGQTVRGCEALMRWKHPLAGEVEPTLFIALAERSGAIVALGNWALAQVCSQLRSWRMQGMPEITLSLNVSLRQLRDASFEASVKQALEEYDVPAHQLELELSETQAMLFVQSDTRHIQALRHMGVRIAIDDYGISFSSLSRLNFLSISSFKINPQCVQDLAHSADARAISNCMIAIGQAMGIEVIAQGVETEVQASVLQGQGCRVMQGFYASHPVSADALFQMVTAR